MSGDQQGVVTKNIMDQWKRGSLNIGAMLDGTTLTPAVIWDTPMGVVGKVGLGAQVVFTIPMTPLDKDGYTEGNIGASAVWALPLGNRLLFKFKFGPTLRYREDKEKDGGRVGFSHPMLKTSTDQTPDNTHGGTVFVGGDKTSYAGTDITVDPGFDLTVRINRYAGLSLMLASPIVVYGSEVGSTRFKSAIIFGYNF